MVTAVLPGAMLAVALASMSDGIHMAEEGIGKDAGRMVGMEEDKIAARRAVALAFGCS